MNDILAPEVSKWQFLEQQARDVLEAFAYHELRTPVLEYTPLFVRSVGEVTDVVEKQMYTFDDRDGPVGQPAPRRDGVGRARVRRERPVEQGADHRAGTTSVRCSGTSARSAAGCASSTRWAAEVFGSGEPSMDAEMIAMLVEMLVRFGLDGSAIEVSVNSLGEPEEREAYRNKLVEYFSGHRDKLDDDSRRRLETNPLRILDSKNPDVIAVAAGAPKLIDELNESSRARFRARARAARGAGRQARDRSRPGSAGWTTTRGRSSRSRRRRASWARRTPSRAAAATTGWSHRWAAEHARDRLRAGHRARAAGDPRAAESYEPALAVFFAPMDGRALDFALPIAHTLRRKGIRIEIEHNPRPASSASRWRGRASCARAPRSSSAATRSRRAS
jgi:hypothetical protein